MKIKLTLLLIFVFNLNYAFGQEEGINTYDNFISEMGIITKFEDYKLNPIQGIYVTKATARIRKVYVREESKLFFQIEIGDTKPIIASISEKDVKEIQAALKELVANIGDDRQSKADYLENKFTTIDDFSIGYYIENGKEQWYISQKNILKKETLFVKDVSVLVKVFSIASIRMEDI